MARSLVGTCKRGYGEFIKVLELGFSLRSLHIYVYILVYTLEFDPKNQLICKAIL